MNSIINKSIAWKLLIRIALASSVVIAIISVIIYGYVMTEFKKLSYEQIGKYTTERVQHENANFKLAEDSQLQLKKELLHRLHKFNNDDPVKEFNRIAERLTDGTMRTPKGAIDPERESAIFIGKDVAVTNRVRRLLVTFNQINNDFGAAWAHRFQNLYIVSPDNFGSLFWPNFPELIYQMPSDTNLERLIGRLNNKNRETIWSDLYFGQFTKLGMVSLVTPVDLEGQHIASIAFDILLDELFERTMNNNLAGTTSLIISVDGQLIMHPEKMDLIREKNGQFDIQSSGDDYLKSIFTMINKAQLNRTVLENIAYDEVISVGLLEQPQWYFVTIYPQSLITKPLFKIIMTIIFLSFIALLISMIAFYWLQSKIVIKPLKQLSDGVKKVTEGDLKIQIDNDLDDEFGNLSRSFNFMTKSLLNYQENLEDLVLQRTEQLKVSEQQFRSIFESMEDAFTRITITGEILMVNQAAADMFGFELGEAITGKWSVTDFYVDPDDRVKVISRIKAEGSLKGYQQVFKKLDGTVFTTEINIHLVNNKDGKPLYTESIYRDISDRLKYEQLLEKNVEKFQDLYDSIPLAYFSADREGHVEYCNKKAIDMFGYAKEDFIGKTPIDFYADPSDINLKKRQDKVLSGIPLEGEEIKLRRADGSTFWASVTSFPEMNGHSRRMMLEDISARKLIEKKLDTARQDAEQANAAKSEFLSRMSHELRTPLNAILGFTQILELDSDNFNANQADAIDEILVGSNHLLCLINDVLDLAKIERGKLIIKHEIVFIDELVALCLSFIEPDAKINKISVVNEIQPGYQVTADFMRLKQVLINLLSNAVKYNSHKGKIVLASKLTDDDKLRLSITDTGDGLTSEQINQLFASFERLGKPDSIEGTGIGLTISKYLIEAMDGSIGVDSNLGKGCEFWIEIPYTKSHEGI